MDKPFTINLTSYKSGDFAINLPDPIRLKVPYEVAIVDLSFVQTWENMKETTFIVVPVGAPEIRVTVPKGYYRGIGSWLEAWHDLIPVGHKEYLTLVKTYAALGWYNLTIGKKDAKANGKIRIDDYAKRVLNLRRNEISSEIVQYADLNSDRYFFLLEADFVEPQHINNNIRPLLAMLRLQFHQFEYYNIFRYHPEFPVFIPVNKNVLQRLSIETFFEERDKPIFEKGWNHLGLYFRPRN